MDTSAPSARATVKRHADRAAYDREVIDAIVDEALYCHVAVIVEGSPRVVPTIHARVGDTLFIHGSNASRTLRALKEGAEACVAVTLVDGLVIARSGFNHSMNYRSVMVYGTLREVTDPAEKLDAQTALVEHVVPSRSAEVRMPNDKELRQTTIMALDLTEASAKVRSGPPMDEEGDYAAEVWAGELPMRMVTEAPVPDPRLPDGIDVPDSVRRYSRPSRPRA